VKPLYKIEITYEKKVLKRIRTGAYEFELPKRAKFGLKLWNNDFKRVAAVVKLGEEYVLGKKEIVIPPRSHAEIFNVQFKDHPMLLHVDFWREQYNKDNVVTGDFAFLCDPYDPNDRSFGFYRRALWDDEPIPNREIIYRIFPEEEQCGPLR